MARRRSRSAGALEESFFTATRSVPRSKSYYDVVSDHDELTGFQRFGTLPLTSDAVYPWAPRHPLRVYNVPSARGFGTGTSQAKRFFPAERFSFKIPRNVRACVRRKERRQVLFALGRAGYSGSARKRHWRRTEDSNWRC